MSSLGAKGSACALDVCVGGGGVSKKGGRGPFHVTRSTGAARIGMTAFDFASDTFNWKIKSFVPLGIDFGETRIHKGTLRTLTLSSNDTNC